MTVSEIIAWIKDAPVGSRMVYHRGCLASDREALSSNGARAYPEVGALATYLHHEEARGNAHLLQRRLVDSEGAHYGYDYMVEKKEATRADHIRYDNLNYGKE